MGPKSFSWAIHGHFFAPEHGLRTIGLQSRRKVRLSIQSACCFGAGLILGIMSQCVCEMSPRMHGQTGPSFRVSIFVLMLSPTKHNCRQWLMSRRTSDVQKKGKAAARPITLH
jgi:hypothetical protein